MFLIVGLVHILYIPKHYTLYGSNLKRFDLYYYRDHFYFIANLYLTTLPLWIHGLVFGLVFLFSKDGSIYRKRDTSGLTQILLKCDHSRSTMGDFSPIGNDGGLLFNANGIATGGGAWFFVYGLCNFKARIRQFRAS